MFLVGLGPLSTSFAIISHGLASAQVHTFKLPPGHISIQVCRLLYRFPTLDEKIALQNDPTYSLFPTTENSQTENKRKAILRTTFINQGGASRAGPQGSGSEFIRKLWKSCR